LWHACCYFAEPSHSEALITHGGSSFPVVFWQLAIAWLFAEFESVATIQLKPVGLLWEVPLEEIAKH
jgi:hypothetical protein